MIFTASYDAIDFENPKVDYFVSISGDRGKKAGFFDKVSPEKGAYCHELAPIKKNWQEWHDNIGLIPEEDNNKLYIWTYYDKVLSKLDPEVIYKHFCDDDSIVGFLCYEKADEFCHRHVASAWMELLTENMVPELEQRESGELIIVNRKRPGWIKEYLNEIMRDNG